MPVKPRRNPGGLLERHGIRLPRTRGRRLALGTGLVGGGLLGFLPILGFWMIPLGLAVLSYDLAWLRHLRRRTLVWWKRRRGRDKVGETGGTPAAQRRRR